ncbi:MAG: hypothetical protein ABFD94_06090 [Armatimonadia bacterium]
MSKTFNLFEGVVTWTDADRQAAQREGWDVFELDSRGVLEIQRCESDDVETPFRTDALAAMHVHERAKAGSELHRKALLEIASHAVSEFYYSQHENMADDLASDVDECQKAYQAGAGGRVCSDFTWPVTAMETLMRTTYGVADEEAPKEPLSFDRLADDVEQALADRQVSMRKIIAELSAMSLDDAIAYAKARMQVLHNAGNNWAAFLWARALIHLELNKENHDDVAKEHR